MNENNIKNFINSFFFGVYIKYVRIVNGSKYLVKLGRGDGRSKIFILEFVIECICYELVKLMGIDCVEYILEDDNNGGLFLVFKWFYDEIKEKFYSVNKLMKILDILRENLYSKLVNNIKKDINNMIVYDYIVNNIDRYLKNFGFLKKGNEIRFLFIYDNGLVLGFYLDDDELEFEDIEDLLFDCDYVKCFDMSNRR